MYLRKLIRSLSYVILGLICLEVIIRVFLYLSLLNYFNTQIPEAYRENMKSIHLPRVLEPWCHFDPLCYYIPTHGFFRGIQGRFNPPTNSVGGEIRIFCLGDSTTYGDAVEPENTWPNRLEVKLKSAFPEKNITVLNGGIPGASSRQAKRIFQIHLVRFKPDIVIWRNGANLTDRYEISLPSSYLRSLVWRLLYESRLFRTLCIIVDQENQGVSETLEAIHDFITVRKGPDLSKEKYNSDFDMVRKIAKDHGASHTIALDYVVKDENGVLSSDLIRFQHEGVGPIIQTLGIFKQKALEVGVEKIFVDHVHMTEIGTEIIAEKIYQYLMKSRSIADHK
jgi:lysophospholipase L1-like esterase